VRRIEQHTPTHLEFSYAVVCRALLNQIFQHWLGIVGKRRPWKMKGQHRDATFESPDCRLKNGMHHAMGTPGTHNNEGDGRYNILQDRQVFQRRHS
jgi:hypothetical protein